MLDPHPKSLDQYSLPLHPTIHFSLLKSMDPLEIVVPRFQLLTWNSSVTIYERNWKIIDQEGPWNVQTIPLIHLAFWNTWHIVISSSRRRKKKECILFLIRPGTWQHCPNAYSEIKFDNLEVSLDAKWLIKKLGSLFVEVSCLLLVE